MTREEARMKLWCDVYATAMLMPRISSAFADYATGAVEAFDLAFPESVGWTTPPPPSSYMTTTG